MSEARIELKYQLDPGALHPAGSHDPFGYLAIEVAAVPFAGSCSVCIHEDDVRKFADDILRMSIGENAPIVLRGGFEQGLGDDLELEIVIESGRLGERLLSAEIAGGQSASSRLKTRFSTDQVLLSEFARELRAIMNGAAGYATLRESAA